MDAKAINQFAKSNRKVAITYESEPKKMLGYFQKPLQPSTNKWGFNDNGTSYELQGRKITNIDYFDDIEPVTGKRVKV